MTALQTKQPMKLKHTTIVALSFLMMFGPTALQAQNERTIIVHPPRPKVGVVLSGGGAKGAAHIGVLKYLEELGIPVDYVAGTSMGSIIGGLYALGYSPDELAVLIADLNWSEYVGNSIDRAAMSPEMRRRSSTTNINIPFSLGGYISEKTKTPPVNLFPSAFVNNTALINLFNDLCVGYQKNMDFNDLPIPFACVATDIKTGEEVVIRRGSVPTAMRASMAIPGVFSPIVMDGHLLVDGGLTNNFPADVLQDMGADIIIGVEVPSKNEIDGEEAPSLPELVQILISNAVNTKRKENRNRCDVYIAPDITGYNTLSFTHDAIDTLVQRGYRKAVEYKVPLTEVKHFIDSVAGYPVTKRLRAPKAQNLADEPLFISSITINQNGKSQSQWLLRKGGLKVGQFISENDINHAIDIYRGTGAFNDITYSITKNGTETIDGKSIDTYNLVMDIKPTQPHVLGVGVRYDTEEGAGMLLSLGLNEKRFGGFKLNLNGRLSYNPQFSIRGTYSRISLADFNLAYDYRSQHFKALIFNNKYTNLRYQHHRLSGYISEFHALNVTTAIGVALSSTSFDHVGSLNFNTDTIDNAIFSSSHFDNNNILSPYFTINYNNLDDSYFARHGIDATLSSHLYIDLNGNGTIVPDLSLFFKSYITPKQGRFTLIPQLYTRVIFDEAYYANLRNVIGGEIAERHIEHQMPFIGVNHVSQAPDLTAILRCDLRYNFYAKHYITATYNFLYGLTPTDSKLNKYKSTQYSGVGLCYSYDSFLGPLSLTAQWSNCTKEFSAYFSIGYTF